MASQIGIFIAILMLENVSGAVSFSDFAASDLLRHARAQQIADATQPMQSRNFGAQPQLRRLRPVEERPIKRHGPPKIRIPKKPFQPVVQRYDQNGNRLRNPAGRRIPPKYNNQAANPRIQEQPRPTFQPIRQHQSPYQPAVGTRKPSVFEPQPFGQPDFDEPVLSRHGDQDLQPVEAVSNDVQSGLYQPALDSYVDRSAGPEVAPSNLNPSYVQSPYGYEAPQEQRSIQEAVEKGANAYHGRDDQGVYQNEERISFQIHGHDGPNSYRYGYDTGHGYNRQFRYEEKDGKGYLKGRYGFFDMNGELKVVNYSADPYEGFHAEGSGIDD